MSYLKLARPFALAALIVLGVGAAAIDSAQAETGIQSEHGPSDQQSSNPNGPACPASKPCN
jgi:hypothetical protein